MWPAKKKESILGLDFKIPEPPPLSDVPDQEMTIYYSSCGSLSKKVIKGKELYHTVPVSTSGGLTYGPLMSIFGNRVHHKPLFTISTQAIITIEIVDVRKDNNAGRK